MKQEWSLRGTLAWALAVALVLLAPAPPAGAASIEVDMTPTHTTNSFSPLAALGAGVDAVPAGGIDQIYTPANITQMLGTGWGRVSYRLFTELGVQHWHWNPTGTWSDPGDRGYWTGATASGPSIIKSFGYRLPHRGFTHDQAYDDDYSRLVDGDVSTYWKSNPYLTATFTGEADALHPQWLLVDLGRSRPVNAVRITWSAPYATTYQVQYWTGGDAIFDQGNGQWQTFPSGTVSSGAGGVVTLTLAPSPISVEFVRVLMTASSGTCDSHGSSDARNCVGYAVAEVGVGTFDGTTFTDLVTHSADGTAQTVTYVSSVDPWHDPTNLNTETEQAGLDLFFAAGGITRGLPAMVPVGMAYGTPADAAAEIAYIEAHGYPVFAVELGEEPDGQLMLPEDYGALYLQWATALHAVDPSLKLGGPVFQGSNEDIAVWQDAGGNTSWFTRFLNYLSAHGRLSDLGFLSFEHYPFDPCPLPWKALLQEPALINGILQTWVADGLPAGLPVYVSEYNLSFDDTKMMPDIFGALWHADFVGSFLAAGGSGAFFYEYEPLPLDRAASCNSWGNFSMFVTDDTYQIRNRISQYASTQLLTQEWAQPVDAAHDVYPVASTITDRRGNVVVTAYALHRPDGQWALLLVNKDHSRAHAITVNFHNAADSSDHSFAGPVSMITFGRTQYRWHPKGPNGYPKPAGPPVTTMPAGGAGATYVLPKASVTVLRGTIG